ncbi:hypothetical protein SAMN02745945_01490 [Peptoclostridium litorale DSM 5388]|uniref:Uncharacterized protein n=1 Tax=Peptoclostridium litorale DSM 5388 TaxID=1121324 RepID=A0A069RF40_PEPLI|nr:hypothetical protein [Peptoclostridium litorale]KDR95639.1 hypothetical protein CLIT_10c03660 [Peptoclostridium litorale DSM 5388]SIN99997.1 hypothetical protein SAMN02745945_01490 [Peptoclostridium litorale DSM 5388]
MITAYLAGISSCFEGEDIEIRYSIYENEDQVCRESIFKEYKKPAVVGLVALMDLLKELEKYEGRDITILINDAALNEQIRGTTTTKNGHVLKMAEKARAMIDEFKSPVTIRDTSGDSVEREQWNEVLKR